MGNSTIAKLKFTTTMANFNDGVAALLKSGAKRVDNLLIKRVNPVQEEKRLRIDMVCDKPVAGYVKDDKAGTFTRVEKTLFNTSSISILRAFEENEDLAWLYSYVSKNQAFAIPVILSYATISIIQEDVVAGQVYTDPFTGKEDAETLEHDNIYNHVVSIKLTDAGRQRVMDVILPAMMREQH